MKTTAGLFLAAALCGCAYEVGADPDEVDSVSEPIWNAIGDATYSRGLVRLDLPGGRCSGFFIAPNMIATAAHCVNDKVNASPQGTWNGMRWGELSVRVVYKPTESEGMCIGATCRDASGAVRRTTMLAWWDAGYSGDGDTGSDMAVLTRTNGANFVTAADDFGGAAPRGLGTGDYLRLLKSKVPTSEAAYVWGYGAYDDSSSDLFPRLGWVYTNYWGDYHVRSDADRESRICAGDSGGPLIYRVGIGGYNFAAGVASNTDARDGKCPESSDAMRWTRTSAKLWMFDRILEWAGEDPCGLYTASGIPGSSQYYRCW